MWQRFLERLESVLTSAERVNRPRLGFAAVAVLIPHAVTLVRIHLGKPLAETLELKNVAVVLLSLVTVVAMGEAIHLVLARRRLALFLASCFYVGSYSWLVGYAVVTGNSLEWDLIMDNLGEIFYLESLELILAWPAPLAVVITVSIVGLGVVLEWKARFVTRWPPPSRRGLALGGWCTAYALVFFLPPFSADETTYFFQTIWRYSDKLESDLSDEEMREAGFDPSSRHPYVRHAPPAAKEDPAPRPHVFIVAMESYNGDFVGKLTPDGKPYTPVLNRQVEQGLWVRRFYANSMQTARGHLSILCSLAPSFKRKVFTGHPNLKLRCLPSILRDHGYDTAFFMASEDLAFDRMGEFMTRNGFNVVKGMVGDMLKPGQEEHFWGWGLQDDVFFGNVFDWLDQDRARKPPGDRKPYFVTLATISHHNPFEPLPKDAPRLFPKPRDFKERLANSQHLADSYLQRFVTEVGRREWLRDSILVFVGDHSFTAGDHGTRFNHVGFHDDHFHTPLVVVWPGKLPPRVIEEVPSSQLDIAPTLLDLLSIREKNHFIGRSVLPPDAAVTPIPIVQPYDGKYLEVVRGWHKYVKHFRTGRGLLFDLQADPMENVNLHDDPAHQETLRVLRRDMSRLYLNQQLIEEDRVWPGP
jgi:arylsulfatase A-like enzyme